MSLHAQVIGDPIVHSLSPAIHRFWLHACGIDGSYDATFVPATDLAGFVERRRTDADWRGCNVTAPHKQAIARMVDELAGEAAAIGAVNCVHRVDGRLVGTNTDIEGIAKALAGLPVHGLRAVIIGSGGAARAAIRHLREAASAQVTLLLRRPIDLDCGGHVVGALALHEARQAFSAADLIVNATPLGLEGGEPMPAHVLDALGHAPPSAKAFDMVYRPVETPFLAAARAAGLSTVDGLSMLIGQARPAFALFFGAEPPQSLDGELRRRLEHLAGQSEAAAMSARR